MRSILGFNWWFRWLVAAIYHVSCCYHYFLWGKWCSAFWEDKWKAACASWGIQRKSKKNGSTPEGSNFILQKHHFTRCFSFQSHCLVNRMNYGNLYVVAISVSSCFYAFGHLSCLMLIYYVHDPPNFKSYMFTLKQSSNLSISHWSWQTFAEMLTHHGTCAYNSTTSWWGRPPRIC